MGALKIMLAVFSLALLSVQNAYTLNAELLADELAMVDAEETGQAYKSTSQLLLALVQQLEKYCGTSSESDRDLCQNALRYLLGNFNDFDELMNEANEGRKDQARTIMTNEGHVRGESGAEEVESTLLVSERERMGMPRSGKRESEYPRSGKRDTQMPRSGKRDIESPHWRKRDIKMPRSGKREGDKMVEKRGSGMSTLAEDRSGYLRSGKRELELAAAIDRIGMPRSGDSLADDYPRSGKREADVMESELQMNDRSRAGRNIQGSGKQEADYPRSGKREADYPRSGKRDAEMPRSGKRDIEMPRSGKRRVKMPRSGKRSIEMPRSGKRETDYPRSGRRNAEMPRSGKREIDYPRSGKREIDYLRSGKREIDYPRSGKRNMDYPRSGKREFDYPRSGKRSMDYPRSGKREIGYPRSGKREIDYPRSGKRDLEILLPRKRKLEMPRSGKKEISEGLRAMPRSRKRDNAMHSEVCLIFHHVFYHFTIVATSVK